MNSVPECDWKVFTRIHPVALERFCEQVIQELEKLLADSAKSSHDRYLATYALVKERNKELANTFDDYRRSTAFWQIAIMYNRGLLTEAEFQQFSSETRNSILASQRIARA